MALSSRIAVVQHQQLWRWYFGIVVFFVLLLLGTWGIRSWRVGYIAATMQERQAKAVEEALALIEAQFTDLQTELLAEAKAVAEAPVVVQGLRVRSRTERVLGPEGLIEFFVALDPAPRTSVELYDPTPRLVAWNGFSMPLDNALNTTRFLETYQTAVVRDDDLRQALAVWWPVREGARVLGAVRVMRLIGFTAPVQNQYLRDFSLEDTWQRATHLPVEVRFERPLEEDPPQTGRARLLQGIDGTVLGRVVVQPPSAETLVQAARLRFSDMVAFWATLLLLWLIGGLWLWYRSGVDLRTGGWLRPALRFVALALGWWGMRYVLLGLDVPARWQRGKAPLSPLFDPTHLASTFGSGLMRSTGDLLITALFSLAFAVVFVDFAARFRAGTYPWRALRARRPAHPSALRFAAVAVLAASAVVVLIYGLGVVTRHAVLDSTLDYFTRTGLLPEPLVLVVFCSLLLITFTAVLLAVGLIWIALRLLLRYRPAGWSPAVRVLVVGTAVVLPFVGLYGFSGLERMVSWPAAAAFLIVGLGVALFGFAERRGVELLTLRSILLSVFLLTVLLYPIFAAGMMAKQRLQMIEAVETFDEARDPRVLFAIEQVLEEARAEPALRRLLAGVPDPTAPRQAADSLARELLRGTLLSSLGLYDVSLTFFEASGAPVGRYQEGEHAVGRATLDQVEAQEFVYYRQMYAERDSTGLMIEQVTGRRERDRLQYVGVMPIYAEAGQAPAGWVTARAEPQTLFRYTETPFPRVLLPAGVSGKLQTSLSLAFFRDGVLRRSLGRDFGRYRLAEAVQQELVTEPELWRTEEIEGRLFETYYRRQELEVPSLDVPLLVPSLATPVIAVRAPALMTFDHLYYLLRLTVSGLFIGMPFYLFGLYFRWRSGLLPSPRVRFRDKVLNAFLAVGIITVAAVGLVGLRVLTEQTEGEVRNWLRQHLEQVEEALSIDLQGSDLAYRVLDRTDIDSLAAREGLDLILYRGAELVSSSRPQLVRDRLIDQRIPIEVFEDLYFDGYRFTYAREQVGSFSYTAGFRALLDEQGQPRLILSVPTLPEQERIEEERARTVAYLFGALLLLVLVVLLTASLLAGAIARPIGRLRAGLEAVAKGQFERNIPVSTRDEIGELVQTFNAMQQQLAESRRRLAQQERQLAWREMARQVAHEIKNPLTPMKLSVQHLRRAYESTAPTAEDEAAGKTARFSSLFDRITSTLIEQIDTLARIANEFSTFARLPTRITERLDLNAVIQEAVDLMQEEAAAEIRLDLDAEPLVVASDREELRRIYINLIKNAIQAIPDGQQGCVEVATRRLPSRNGAHGWAYSSVADNGVGVPPDLREKIFEPNFSTKTSGTGLGLAITRKSVEEMAGEIGFETEEGAGTTFWIRLPLAEE